MVALHYGIHVSDKDLGKYVKMHIDDGLNLLNEEVASNSNIDGFDFLIDKIKNGLNCLT
jgi:DNA sulfur modification protein DndE